MRVDDTCQAHRCAGRPLGSTRITQDEVAARNRRARFPASHCGGVLRIASAVDPARPRLDDGSDKAMPNRVASWHNIRAIDRVRRGESNGIHCDGRTVGPAVVI
jgi:hypothetical protein